MTNGGGHWRECEAATISAFGLGTIFHPLPPTTLFLSLCLYPPQQHLIGDTFPVYYQAFICTYFHGIVGSS